MAADWKRIRAVFEEAIAIEPDARPAFLDAVCGTDDGLRRDVDSLLEEHDRPGSFVGDSPIARLAALELVSGTAKNPGSTHGREFQAAFSAGVIVGDRYRIGAEVGRGGMGEVYRARDARLGRDVALKVMPALSVSDPDRLRRFDLEARAAGALNHPNVLAIHDVGMHDGAPFIVSELLVGETLRERLKRGPLSLERAIDYGIQVARGLAAAHEKGIVHRDLKLENLFLTKEGHVKILDFGIAKLMDHSLVEGLNSTDAGFAQHTMEGAVMGTASYMSPEQARGASVDHRSDIFSLGVILYEMLTGQRAFDRRSVPETLNAIINDEPVRPSELNPGIPSGLERTMLHCLEKNPDDRFQTASDLCLALGEVTSGFGSHTAVPAMPQRQWRWRRYATSGAAAVALLAVGFGADYALRSGQETPAEPTARQISYRRGYIPYQCARFAPDGETIIYSAAWDGDSTDLYLGRTDSFESRPLGFPAGRLCSVSKSGEIALIFNRGNVFGTLARVAMTGTSPRELVDGSMHADWTPDGKSLAAVLATAERLRVECPLGNVIYTLPMETRALNAIRVSPRGDRIALLEGRSAAWILFLVDMTGHRTELTSRNLNGQGIAWAPDGNEIFFTRSEAGKTVVWATTLEGVERRVASFLGDLRLADVSPDGRKLLMIRTIQHTDIACNLGGSGERNLTWLGLSVLAGVSDDGTSLLFGEPGYAGGPAGSVFFQKIGNPPVRLGDGTPLALSPDGRWALALLRADQKLILLPTGAGQPRELERGSIERYNTGASERWLSDGTSVMFAATEPGHEMRTYVQRVDGGPPVAITPDGTTAHLVSPDCRSVILDDARPESIGYYVAPIGGGPPRAIPGLENAPNKNVPLYWSADGKYILVAEDWNAAPQRLFRVDLETGARTFDRDLMPIDRVGVDKIIPVRFTADGRYFAFSYRRTLSELLLIEEIH